MNKNFLIGIGVVALGGGIILFCHYKPIYDNKRLIRLFIDKNYASVSEQLTDAEQKKLEKVIFNLTDKEKKTLLMAYKNGADKVDMDELKRVLDKLKPVMDEIKPAFDIKRIEHGKKEIALYIKNAVNPSITFNYGGDEVKKILIPLTKAGKDEVAMLKLVYDKGKLTAYEGDTKIQEEEIIEQKQIEKLNKQNK